MEILNEYEDKILELRRIIHDKEYTIQELEKIKPILDIDNIVTKYKEVYILYSNSGSFVERINFAIS